MQYCGQLQTWLQLKCDLEDSDSRVKLIKSCLIMRKDSMFWSIMPPLSVRQDWMAGVLTLSSRA